MSGRLRNKIAIVTGAGSGIGRAMAERFAAEGAHVIAADISGKEAELARRSGDMILGVHCDVADPQSVAQLIETCRARFGRLDVLANNAGQFLSSTPLHETSFADWDRVMGVNVRGAFAVLKFALPLMIKSGGGAIVNTASIGSFRAVPGAGAYIASKGALLMLTKQAALEYAQDNIRVNAICPGSTETDGVRNLPKDQLEFLINRIPMGRLVTTDEVAALALFLVSDEASGITGSYHIVDGGICAATGRPPRVERHIA